MSISLKGRADWLEDPALQTLLGALSQGGEIRQKLAPVFFTSLYSAFTDRYGIRWMVMTEMPAP